MAQRGKGKAMAFHSGSDFIALGAKSGSFWSSTESSINDVTHILAFLPSFPPFVRILLLSIMYYRHKILDYLP